jgi:hypothetical protein
VEFMSSADGCFPEVLRIRMLLIGMALSICFVF